MEIVKNPYACAVCAESFTNAKTLVSHVKTKHEAIQPTEKDDIKPSVGKSKNETEKAH